jgi:UDP-N-acetylglucosamine--N-acetylmuramyl-(pentapeptide) pyrophosphoryl-undecaprenol N-acetylglucosamine transferase
MSGPVYIFAGGGTGGHLYPALAVAEEFAAVRPGARIVFACSQREIDRRILSPTPYARVAQPIRPLPRSPRGWGRFVRGLLSSGLLGGDLVRDLRPAAVFGLGGFAAVPVVLAAADAGVPTGLLCIDAVPGLANRFLAGRAEVIFTQFAQTAGHLRRHRSKLQQLGCPVRPALLKASSAEARQHFGLRGERRTLLVAAGSQGAANINEAVAAIRPDLDELAGRWQVLHVPGPGKAEQVRAAYQGGRIHHVVVEFCRRMDLAYAVADLALCRAGASTIAELTATGTPAVLMPYPYHRDQQQRHNAEELVARGGAEMVVDAADAGPNAQALRRSLLPLMRDPSRLEGMRAAAARLARPAAAEDVARCLARLKQKTRTGR